MKIATLFSKKENTRKAKKEHEKSVKSAADFAVRKYRKTFEDLARYDRENQEHAVSQ